MKFNICWLFVAALALNAHSGLNAQILELRGSGILPEVGTPSVGVPGEAITVSVTLNSADFEYIPLSNSAIHYFAPSAVIPVGIVGSVSGEYAGVSPIARFVALELESSSSRGDMLGLDVASGTSGTSLLSLSTSGASGFDGTATPKNTADLFALFAGAMNDQGFWKPSSSSAVFVGENSDLLFLGQLEWTLINPTGDVDTDATGDVDRDGDVDGRDFLLWQRDPSIGSLTDWLANYAGSSGLPKALAVPEPTSVSILLICGGMAVFLRPPACRIAPLFMPFFRR